jgi:cell wall-associated NlpC family hydrolase
MPTLTLDRVRLGRIAVALGLSAALAGGTAVSQAPESAAAPAAPTVQTSGLATATVATSTGVTPRTSFTISKRNVIQGMDARPVFRLAASTPAGKPLQGRAKLIVNGSVVATKTLDSSGVARWRPWWSKYRAGANYARVVVMPASGTGLSTKSTTTRTVTVWKHPGAKVVHVAKRYIGYPYVYGGSSPSGFDCSGLTQYVYKRAISKWLPRSSSAQKDAGRVVARSNARPGDLIWTPGHVAIFIGNGRQIDAGKPATGVVLRQIWQSNPTFVRVV